MATCLFCDWKNKTQHRIIAEDQYAYSRWDNFPVSPGHLEVVPKRHVESFFDLTGLELLSIFCLLRQARDLLETPQNDAGQGLFPDGYNIGVNEGEAAGRTVHHVHWHLIPRYKGDVPNPRGGVRHIIPGKGDYDDKRTG